MWVQTCLVFQKSEYLDMEYIAKMVYLRLAFKTCN